MGGGVCFSSLVGLVRRCHLRLVSPLQSLSIKTSSPAEAENMADLIDGYCRLQGEHKGSLIIHSKKGGCPLPGRVAQQQHSWAMQARQSMVALPVAQEPVHRLEESGESPT